MRSKLASSIAILLNYGAKWRLLYYIFYLLCLDLNISLILDKNFVFYNRKSFRDPLNQYDLSASLLKYDGIFLSSLGFSNLSKQAQKLTTTPIYTVLLFLSLGFFLVLFSLLYHRPVGKKRIGYFSFLILNSDLFLYTAVTCFLSISACQKVFFYNQNKNLSLYITIQGSKNGLDMVTEEISLINSDIKCKTIDHVFISIVSFILLLFTVVTKFIESKISGFVPNPQNLWSKKNNADLIHTVCLITMGVSKYLFVIVVGTSQDNSPRRTETLFLYVIFAFLLLLSLCCQIYFWPYYSSWANKLRCFEIIVLFGANSLVLTELTLSMKNVFIHPQLTICLLLILIAMLRMLSNCRRDPPSALQLTYHFLEYFDSVLLRNGRDTPKILKKIMLSSVYLPHKQYSFSQDNRVGKVISQIQSQKSSHLSFKRTSASSNLIYSDKTTIKSLNYKDSSRLNLDLSVQNHFKLKSTPSMSVFNESAKARRLSKPSPSSSLRFQFPSSSQEKQNISSEVNDSRWSLLWLFLKKSVLRQEPIKNFESLLALEKTELTEMFYPSTCLDIFKDPDNSDVRLAVLCVKSLLEYEVQQNQWAQGVRRIIFRGNCFRALVDVLAKYTGNIAKACALLNKKRDFEAKKITSLDIEIQKEMVSYQARINGKTANLIFLQNRGLLNFKAGQTNFVDFETPFKYYKLSDEIFDSFHRLIDRRSFILNKFSNGEASVKTLYSNSKIFSDEIEKSVKKLHELKKLTQNRSTQLQLLEMFWNLQILQKLSKAHRLLNSLTKTTKFLVGTDRPPQSPSSSEAKSLGLFGFYENSLILGAGLEETNFHKFTLVASNVQDCLGYSPQDLMGNDIGMIIPGMAKQTHVSLFSPNTSSGRMLESKTGRQSFVLGAKETVRETWFSISLNPQLSQGLACMSRLGFRDPQQDAQFCLCHPHKISDVSKEGSKIFSKGLKLDRISGPLSRAVKIAYFLHERQASQDSQENSSAEEALAREEIRQVFNEKDRKFYDELVQGTLLKVKDKHNQIVVLNLSLKIFSLSPSQKLFQAVLFFEVARTEEFSDHESRIYGGETSENEGPSFFDVTKTQPRSSKIFQIRTPSKKKGRSSLPSPSKKTLSAGKPFFLSTTLKTEMSDELPSSQSRAAWTLENHLRERLDLAYRQAFGCIKQTHRQNTSDWNRERHSLLSETRFEDPLLESKINLPRRQRFGALFANDRETQKTANMVSHSLNRKRVRKKCHLMRVLLQGLVIILTLFNLYTGAFKFIVKKDTLLEAKLHLPYMDMASWAFWSIAPLLGGIYSSILVMSGYIPDDFYKNYGLKSLLQAASHRKGKMPGYLLKYGTIVEASLKNQSLIKSSEKAQFLSNSRFPVSRPVIHFPPPETPSLSLETSPWWLQTKYITWEESTLSHQTIRNFLQPFIDSFAKLNESSMSSQYYVYNSSQPNLQRIRQVEKIAREGFGFESYMLLRNLRLQNAMLNLEVFGKSSQYVQNITQTYSRYVDLDILYRGLQAVTTSSFFFLFVVIWAWWFNRHWRQWYTFRKSELQGSVESLNHISTILSALHKNSFSVYQKASKIDWFRNIRPEDNTDSIAPEQEVLKKAVSRSKKPLIKLKESSPREYLSTKSPLKKWNHNQSMELDRSLFWFGLLRFSFFLFLIQFCILGFELIYFSRNRKEARKIETYTKLFETNVHFYNTNSLLHYLAKSLVIQGEGSLVDSSGSGGSSHQIYDPQQTFESLLQKYDTELIETFKNLSPEDLGELESWYREITVGKADFCQLLAESDPMFYGNCGQGNSFIFKGNLITMLKHVKNVYQQIYDSWRLHKNNPEKRLAIVKEPMFSMMIAALENPTLDFSSVVYYILVNKINDPLKSLLESAGLSEQTNPFLVFYLKFYGSIYILALVASHFLIFERLQKILSVVNSMPIQLPLRLIMQNKALIALFKRQRK